jgi:hypothetical protein
MDRLSVVAIGDGGETVAGGRKPCRTPSRSLTMSQRDRLGRRLSEKLFATISLQEVRISLIMILSLDARRS